MVDATDQKLSDHLAFALSFVLVHPSGLSSLCELTVLVSAEDLGVVQYDLVFDKRSPVGVGG